MQERPCQVLQNMDTAWIELQSTRFTRWIIDFNFIGRIGGSSQSALMDFAFLLWKNKEYIHTFQKYEKEIALQMYVVRRPYWPSVKFLVLFE